MSPNDRLEASAAYLADGDQVRAEQAGIVGDERLALERVRGLLADEAMWADPPEYGAVAADIEEPESAAEPAGRVIAGPWRRRALLAVAAAAAVVLVVGLVGRRDAGDEGVQVALAGTELAPDARATATLRSTPSGEAITLDVEGLDPAPPGFYYQAWVKGPDGLVPIGTFHVRGGVDEPIELWSGVDRAAYPSFTVTLEPEDGDATSSGRRVLAGELDDD